MNDKVETFISLPEIGDYELIINKFQLRNPGIILDEFYQIRHNQELTNEEKINQVKKIISEYMG